VIDFVLPGGTDLAELQRMVGLVADGLMTSVEVEVHDVRDGYATKTVQARRATSGAIYWTVVA